MSITARHTGTRIAVKTPFELKDVIKAIPGRLWDKPNKVWTLPATPSAAAALRETFESHGLAVDTGTLQLLADHEAATAALAHKTGNDLDDFPSRTTAWMHQRQAFHYAAPRRGAMLAMDMGTGKSKTAIGLLDHWGAGLTIILAPPKATRVWPREFHGGDVEEFDGHSLRDWLVVNGRGVTGKSGRVLKNPSMRQRVDQAKVAIETGRTSGRPVAVVVNYEAFWQPTFLTFLKDALKAAKAAGQVTALVCDESHKIKAAGGKWSRSAHSLGQIVDRALCLTGTPNPHSEPDLYAQFRVLDPGVFGTNYSQFLHRYFEMGGFEGREVRGFKTEDTERAFIKAFSDMAFICDSDDVLDLPPESDLPTLTTSLSSESAKHYASMEGAFFTALDGGDDSDGDEVFAENALAQLLRLAQITSGHLPVDRDGERSIVQIGTEKAKLLADTLDDLPADEPTVIFGRFHHDMATIQAAVEAKGLRYGEISGRGVAQDGLTEDATMRPDIDVVGVQLQAGGTGIDLTRARYAIYYALDFNLGDFKQSRKRVHRPGQTRETFFIYLACEGTVDETIATALRERDTVMTALKNSAKAGL